MYADDDWIASTFPRYYNEFNLHRLFRGMTYDAYTVGPSTCSGSTGGNCDADPRLI